MAVEENDRIIVPAEIVSEPKLCRFCGKELNVGMTFCTRCGKNQEDVSQKAERPKRVIRKAKRSGAKATKVLSFMSFGVSFVIMLFAIVRMFLYNTASLSIFGASYDGLIINQTVVVGSLMISMMFLKLGIFLYKE